MHSGLIGSPEQFCRVLPISGTFVGLVENEVSGHSAEVRSIESASTGMLHRQSRRSVRPGASTAASCSAEKPSCPSEIFPTWRSPCQRLNEAPRLPAMDSGTQSRFRNRGSHAMPYPKSTNRTPRWVPYVKLCRDRADESAAILLFWLNCCQSASAIGLESLEKCHPCSSLNCSCSRRWRAFACAAAIVNSTTDPTQTESGTLARDRALALKESASREGRLAASNCLPCPGAEP